MRSVYLAQERGDHDSAFHMAQQLAATGNRRALFFLGTAYAEGLGVTRDLDQADALFRRYVVTGGSSHARRSEADRAESVANYYDDLPTDSVLGTANLVRATHWYQYAVEFGSTRALTKLAYRYRFGRGVPKNPEKALKLYRRAADSRTRFGVFADIGDLYLSGELGEVDFVSARKAYLEGVADNDWRSAFKLGNMYLDGVGVERDVHVARAWWEIAAQIGHPIAPLHLMRGYLRGTFPEPNARVKGLAWFLVLYRLFDKSDEAVARGAASYTGISPFSSEEIRDARRLADRILYANPNLTRSGKFPIGL